MENLQPILHKFSPISLEEMEDVNLQNRMDTKFMFTSKHLPSILEKLSNDYRILEVRELRLSKYKTLYYDTEDFQLYTAHQNGRTNRYKIRARNYVDSGLSFFEIKFKDNKGRTIKERVKIKKIKDILGNKVSAFIKERTPFDGATLKPKLWVNYSRTTLVNMFTKERVTIDNNLTFEKGELTKTFDRLTIVEVKQNKASSSAFGKLMKEMHIMDGSISKYCIGITQLYDDVKKNNFKPQLLLLDKIFSK